MSLSKNFESPKRLASGLFFGLLFGFLLQKGGVAKFDVLMGALLLEDFTVMKVILSAILVGMLGIYALHALGKVELQLKPTRYAANSIGGLIFGVGFALSAYCPGTGAAALGQGNFDALAVMVGMIVGSYIYAIFSEKVDRRLGTKGAEGELTFPQLLKLKLSTCILIVCGLILTFLIVLEETR